MKRLLITLTLILLAGSAFSMALKVNDEQQSSIFFGAYHQTDNNLTRITIGSSTPIMTHLYALTYGDVGGVGGSANAELVYFFKPVSGWKLNIGVLAGPNAQYDDPTFNWLAATGLIAVSDIKEKLGAWATWKATVGSEAGLNKWNHIFGAGLYFYIE